jgi:hypothetical protein
MSFLKLTLRLLGINTTTMGVRNGSTALKIPQKQSLPAESSGNQEYNILVVYLPHIAKIGPKAHSYALWAFGLLLGLVGLSTISEFNLINNCSTVARWFDLCLFSVLNLKMRLVLRHLV